MFKNVWKWWKTVKPDQRSRSVWKPRPSVRPTLEELESRLVPSNITGLSPNYGPTTGSTSVIVNGSGLTGTTAVTFGGTEALEVHVLSDTQLQAYAPAESAGVVNVVVTAPSGTSPIVSADQFTYQAVQTATSTLLYSSANPSYPGQAVTFTAVVSHNGSGTPTGTVTFNDGSTVLGTENVSSNGQATLTTTALPLGDQSITAAYSGDANFSGSTSQSLSQMVQLASTSTMLYSSANPSTYGQAVTFTASVSNSVYGTPTGTVTFEDGTTTLGTAALSSAGQAVFTTSALAIGNHSITAVYSGDASFAGSVSGVLNLAVDPLLVTNQNDTGAGSLRAAITAANIAGGNPEIDFQAGLSGTITLESALPDITANTNLVGPGAGTITVARDPNAATTFRIFTVDANNTCSISNLGITGGVAEGGGVQNSGTLKLTNDNIYENGTTNLDDGGGIENTSSGTLTVVGCSITDNKASGYGGGIFNNGTLTILGQTSLSENNALVGAALYNKFSASAIINGYTVINDNTASQEGGGIANFGDLSMNSGLIDDNVVTGNAGVQDGGGLYEAIGGSATLTGVGIEDNSAGAGMGGGFYLGSTASLTLKNCTVSNNIAATGNGGYVQNGATDTLTNCTITDQIVQGP